MKRSAGSPKSVLALGLMSGTSADGIDVALVRIRPGRAGAHLALDARLENFHAVPYPAALRAEILRLAGGARCTPADVSNLNFHLGEIFARAALAACVRFRVKPQQIALIGSHGQTIYHQASPRAYLQSARVRSTLQIAEPAVIAERTGITTVSDFRPADMAAGGQGAPLVPFVDYLLYRHPARTRIALNIGGIANLTVIPANARPGQVTAFDTGPGNMVIDALVRHFTRGRQSFDRNARIAQRGQLLPTLLTRLLADPYSSRRPPKSCGREQFGDAFAQRILAWGRKNKARPEDLVRTATLLTPLSIVMAVYRWVLPRLAHSVTVEPIDLILSGGGAHNPLIRAQLEASLRGHGVRLLTSADFGLPEDAKEAFAFAILAYETLHRRPSNLPVSTGARHPAILGKICYASR
jgi:anhydro-N-acetylmuramic acid kinase